MVTTEENTDIIALEQRVWQILGEINDPEIPVLSIVDLGIIRSVKAEHHKVTITITPTYSGCPAMDVISMEIRMQLMEAGFKSIDILQQLSPAWTTEWMSAAGKEKLESYGIAPPSPKGDTPVRCPLCHSTHVKLLSQFGSTACKALYQCVDCKEPFDYFKCH
jgi:ring-1,2-phenylacetyl-CoA epoxidase subunit PaaD